MTDDGSRDAHGRSLNLSRRSFLSGAAGLTACSAPPSQPRPTNAISTPNAPPRNEVESAEHLEAEARKQRSIALLRRQRIPHDPAQPCRATEAGSRRRASTAVVERMVALAIVSQVGATNATRAQIARLIDFYGAERLFTDKERRFLDDPAPSELVRVTFGWSAEAELMLGWALGSTAIDPFDRARPSDFPSAQTLESNEFKERFARSSTLRPQAEILDASDMLGRYLWAVNETPELQKRLLMDLYEGVLIERQRALDWLLSDRRWDDITVEHEWPVRLDQ